MSTTETEKPAGTFTSRVDALRAAVRDGRLYDAGVEPITAKSHPPGFQKFHNSTPPFDNRPDYPTWDKRGR